MSRSIFGWDLPPGCTQRHIDEAFGGPEICECCGNHAEACICPECFVCGDIGNPDCYSLGHESDDVRLCGQMEYSKEQLIGRSKLRISQLEDQLADERMALDFLQSQKEEDERTEK
jgi:hypothetical protein